MRTKGLVLYLFVCVFGYIFSVFSVVFIQRSFGNGDLGCILLFLGTRMWGTCRWCRDSTIQNKYRMCKLKILSFVVSISQSTPQTWRSDVLCMQNSILVWTFQSSKCQGYNSTENESSQAQSINYPSQAIVSSQVPNHQPNCFSGGYFMPSYWNLNHRYSLSFGKIKTFYIESPSFNMHRRKNHRTGATSE